MIIRQSFSIEKENLEGFRKCAKEHGFKMSSKINLFIKDFIKQNSEGGA